jgi:hypothetical protein
MNSILASPDLTRFPRFPMSGPPTGHEGTSMLSLPGHTMIYNDQAGMEGVEIETPEGMLISFATRYALERFIRENRVSADDAAALRAIDARAMPVRTEDVWVPAATSDHWRPG